MSKQRSTALFEESIKSKYTKKNYASHLNQLIKYVGMDSIDQLLSVPHSELQHMLENYLIELKQTTNPNSVPSRFQGIRHFCIMNEINLNWDIIRKMFPQKQKAHSLRAYTASEVREMLSSAASLRDKAIIHFLASTGSRVGVFDHVLSVRHMRKMPHGCTAVLLYAGDIEEYWAFLTPQASSALKTYHDYRRRGGEVFCKDTPVFATRRFPPKQLGWSGVRSVVYRTISKSKIVRDKHGDRYDVQADHGFRKRFNTILKLDNAINYNVAEKLMGHKNGLDGVYFTPTLEELLAEFRKVMHKVKV